MTRMVCNSCGSENIWRDAADVEQWGVKWHTLHIFWCDGTEDRIELGEVGPDGIDTKRPSAVTIEADDEPYGILDEL